LTAGEASAYWRSRAFEWMARHPGQFLRLAAVKGRMLLNRVEAADTEDIDSYAAVSWPVRLSLVLFNFGVIAPLGAVGWWQTRNRWKTLWPLYAMAILYAGTLILFFVLDRYRYPLAAFAAMFAGAAIASVSERNRTAPLHRRAALVTVGVVAAVVCNWPVAVLDAERMRGATSYNLATALQESGRTEEAIARYRESIARVPGFAPAHLNLGVLLAKANQQDAALAEYEMALRLDPRLAEAHNNIASERAARAEYAEAISHFRESLRLDYPNAGTHYNFATALAAAGDMEGARREFEETLKLDPRKADAHNNLGSVLASEGRYAEAIEQFRAALAINPEVEGARQNLSRAEALIRAGAAR
jgi:tetratricopeptide (TPR) repeat protein